MKKIYASSLFLFGVAPLTYGTAPDCVETLFQQWEALTKRTAERKEKIIFANSKKGREGGVVHIPEQLSLNTISSPEGKALYKSIAKFDQIPDSHGKYEPEDIKQKVLDVCEAFSEDSSENERCQTKFVENREELCQAAPMVARDTCEDILNTAASSDDSLDTAQPSPEKTSRWRQIFNKIKFWNRNK